MCETGIKHGADPDHHGMPKSNYLSWTELNFRPIAQGKH